MKRELVYLISLVALLGGTGPVAWGQANQVRNPEFDNGLNSWGLYGAAGFTASVVPGAHLSGANAALLNVTDPTVASIGISQGGLTFEKGKTYPIGFMAKADKEREMVLLIQLSKPEGPTWVDIVLERIKLTTEPQTFLFEYTHNDDSMADHPAWVATMYLMLKGQWWSMTGSDLVSKVWVDRVHVGEQPPLVDSTNLYAYAPVPPDGSTLDQAVAILEWKPGDFAVSHKVYFGEDLDAVSSGSVQPVITTDKRAIMGFLPPYATGLMPGQVYYWRVDEVNDANPESPWQGPVWNFLVRPLTAWKPVPADGSKFVGTDQDLGWETGANALFHTLYFGENAEEVAAAATGGWMGIDTQRELDPLKPATTYYWRVDEFVGTGTHTGAVWSFTTAGPAKGIKGEYFNNPDASGAAVVTRTDPQIDFDWGTGDVPGQNSPDAKINVDNFSARWTGEIEADRTDSYVFSITGNNGYRLWIDGRLVIDFWNNLTTDTRRSAPIALTAGETYSLRLEYSEGTGAALAHLFWESAAQNRPSARVREIVPSGAMGPALKAHSPEPANGAVDTPQTTALQWTAGDQATRHHIYLGPDMDAVAQADATTTAVYRGGQNGTTFDPGALEWGRAYYWRVDEEEAGGTIRKGNVWTFTTADFIVVDDFEGYTDESPDRIFQTWIDGLGYTDPATVAGNSTGSTVGNASAPFAEQNLVHGGRQSMPVNYDNTLQPYHSEVERTWAAPQDWTANGIDTLVFYFRGHTNNGEGRVYVAVEDTTGRVGVAVHPGPQAVASVAWLPWSIPLGDFASAGVNLAAVKTMYIGIGNRVAPTAGGAGKFYVDDIRLVRSSTTN